MERYLVNIVFRKLQRNAPLPPAAGEIHILPNAPEHRERRDHARLVLQHGAGVFLAGGTLIERVVVDAEPTLDDLLAATLAIQLLSGSRPAEGAAAFAEYAALVREGYAARDPWFDGKPFGHTLVVAPKSGSVHAARGGAGGGRPGRRHQSNG